MGERITGEVGGNRAPAFGEGANFPGRKHRFPLWRASPAGQACSCPWKSALDLGEKRPEGAASRSPGGSPVPVTASVPVPQIDASTVAPQLAGGIFGAGSWPPLGRLSAFGLRAFGAGRGRRTAVLSVGNAAGRGVRTGGRLQQGGGWAGGQRDFGGAQALCGRAETTDAAIHFPCLCSKNTRHLSLGICPSGWALLSPVLYPTFSQMTPSGHHTAEASVSSTLTFWEQRGRSDRPDGSAQAKSREWRRLGCQRGRRQPGPGGRGPRIHTRPQGTCSRLLGIIHKAVPSCALPCWPFANPNIRCCPVPGTEALRRGRPPCSFHKIPNVETLPPTRHVIPGDALAVSSSVM